MAGRGWKRERAESDIVADGVSARGAKGDHAAATVDAGGGERSIIDHNRSCARRALSKKTGGCAASGGGTTKARGGATNQDRAGATDRSGAAASDCARSAIGRAIGIDPHAATAVGGQKRPACSGIIAPDAFSRGGPGVAQSR